MSLRDKAQALVEARGFQRAVTAVILFNAVTLGAETSQRLTEAYGGVLTVLDRAALTVFVVELLIKMYAYRGRFFRDPWNCFDFLVVGIALVPTAGAFSVLRALRVLRVLRLISVVPSMRNVVAALLAAIPGVASIVGLLTLVVYVSAVMATKLFGEAAPQHFGNLGESLWTLFQVMTGESWPDVADDVMAEQPAAWIFFLIFILVSTFVVLNLFLAVMVNAMESVREQAAAQVAAPPRPATLPDQAGAATPPDQAAAATPPSADGGLTPHAPAVDGVPPRGADTAVLAELAALRREVSALRGLLEQSRQDVPEQR